MLPFKCIWVKPSSVFSNSLRILILALAYMLIEPRIGSYKPILTFPQVDQLI